MDASLRYPQDYSYFIQNVSQKLVFCLMSLLPGPLRSLIFSELREPKVNCQFNGKHFDNFVGNSW